jgi:hypothetical protein
MRRFEALGRILRHPEKYALRVARVMERQPPGRGAASVLRCPSRYIV